MGSFPGCSSIMSISSTRWVDGTLITEVTPVTLVDPYTWPWSPNGHDHGHEWHTTTSFVQCQSALPFWDTTISKFYHENLWSRSSVWSKVKVTFDLQNSKVKVMVKFKTHWSHFRPGIQSICLLFVSRQSTGQGQQLCQKWKKSKKLFKSYRVNNNLQPAAEPAGEPAAAAGAAYEPVQKHKVTPSILGWLNY